jgi:hypothetical protein
VLLRDYRYRSNVRQVAGHLGEGFNERIPPHIRVLLAHRRVCSNMFGATGRNNNTRFDVTQLDLGRLG